MIKKITLEFLKEKGACDKGIEWFKSQKKTESISVLKELLSDAELDWANWLIVRIMERRQYLSYAIYAAEQVLDIYEAAHTKDKCLRIAIQAAKDVVKHDTQKNREKAAYAAAYAADAAYAASVSSDAFAVAASDAADASSAAYTTSASSSTLAAYAAYAASASSASSAASAAADAAWVSYAASASSASSAAHAAADVAFAPYAAYAAYTAADAAWVSYAAYATYAAYADSDSAHKKMSLKILKYGLKLLQKESKL